MKKNYITVAALFGIGIIFFNGCKKDKQVDDPYQDHTMPKEMYDYGYFLPGTYWIYEDSGSGSIDSVWVWDAYRGMDTLNRSNSYGLDAGIYDWFKIKTTSTHFNADYYYYANSSHVANKISFPLYREILSATMLRESRCFRFQYEIGKIYYGYSSQNGGDTQKCVTFLPQFLLLSQTYPNVVEYEQSANYVESNSHTFFFHSQNYGIVRKEILSRNEVWNLVRFNIVQ